MNAMPIILDFNAAWSASFIRFNKAEMEVSSGRSGGKIQVFRIRFDAGRFPGVSINEPAPEWSAYSNLGFKVLSDHSMNMDLYVRIHDIYHDNNYQDRFNQKLVIYPGLNEIIMPLAQIEKSPLNRELDLANITGLILFLRKVEKSQLLHISKYFSGLVAVYNLLHWFNQWKMLSFFDGLRFCLELPANFNLFFRVSCSLI